MTDPLQIGCQLFSVPLQKTKQNAFYGSRNTVRLKCLPDGKDSGVEWAASGGPPLITGVAEAGQIRPLYTLQQQQQKQQQQTYRTNHSHCNMLTSVIH
jgi:hypothetical protein